MNLPLHTGWLGALEAGALAFAVGLLAYLLSHFVARALRWPEGHAIGWAAFAAVAIGAGIDLWHLFSLFFVNPGSPARVQLALAGIHDPARSEEHTSELQSLMRIPYDVFCLKK